MDLVEVADDSGFERHPWEIARLAAVRTILDRTLLSAGPRTALDVGCGDAFLSRRLFGDRSGWEVTCIDVHLSAEQVERFARVTPRFTYCHDYSQIAGLRFDLLLLLDVLEHVEDDRALLLRLTRDHLRPGGQVLIMVPAIPALYGSHDVFLKHYRRYERRALVELARSCGVRVIAAGSLFACLVIPRWLSVWWQAHLGDIRQHGIGNWRYGPLVSAATTMALRADSGVCRFLGRLGIQLPGLTAWVLCEQATDL
jgi:SAM-dependent methyltransferase